MNPLELGPREIEYENRYQRVYRIEANLCGLSKEYYLTDYGERAGLVSARGEDVLLVRQYRLLIEGLSWEIPGGKVDKGETPEEAAARECLEEAGVRCHNLRPLIFFHPGLDTLNNPTHVFYTEDWEEAGENYVHSGEVHERQWVPLTNCIEMVFAGEIVDSLSVIALLAYRNRLARQ